jgi:hypothetical protein
MIVEQVFAEWAIACVQFLLSQKALVPHFLADATLVLGGEEDLPTSAPEGTLEHAEELLAGVAVHAGREGVAHEIVEVPPDDASLEPFAEGEIVGVPLPSVARGDRWSTIAMLARGVVTPVVLDVADRGPGGVGARSPLIDLATVLSGFGPPVLRAAEQGRVLVPHGGGRHGSDRLRELDGIEVAFVHAIFETLHDLDPAESEPGLEPATCVWLRDGRAAVKGYRTETLRARAMALGALATYRER